MTTTTTTTMRKLVLVTAVLSTIASVLQALTVSPLVAHRQTTGRSGSALFSTGETDSDDIGSMLTARFPTSVDDQVRQAADSLKKAAEDGIHRHCVRLLLPLIGPTDLDDWPGGAKQMIEAAFPLMETVLQINGAETIGQSILDESDGVRLMMAQAEEAKDDSCTVLLPSADTVQELQSLDGQVGPNRDLIIVNPQWKRQSDFGFFGRQERLDYVEEFVPTFSCTNQIVEGDQLRILRTYPGPWRVYLRVQDDQDGSVDWIEIGSKDAVDTKPDGWEKQKENKQDGGRLFDYGKPTYSELQTMITSREGYRPKTVTERAAAAFAFTQDSL